jgi:putative transposase
MSQSALRPSGQAAQPLTDARTLEFTVDVLTQHFDLEATGYCCQTRDLWQVLVAAAARGSTIEATCHDLKDAPDSNTVRTYLNEQLTSAQVRPLEAQFNQALASQLPRWFVRSLRRPNTEFALDLHDVPYYGKLDQDQAVADQAVADQATHWICRGAAQVGTTRFYRSATAYVLQDNKRWTLAVTFVHPRDSLLAIVQRLLEPVRSLGLRRGCVYLDKAFSGIPVLRYLLQETKFAAVVATPVRGKAGAKAGAEGGTRALCRGRASYRTDYTFRSATHGTLAAPVGVVRTWSERRDGTRQSQWLVYVLIRCRWRIREMRRRYRRRFGIESSYRLLEQVRLRTSSPNEALRFLALGLALLLGSVWIALHWRYLRVPGSGPRRVLRERFTLEQMANFLRRAVEAIYGVLRQLPPPATIGIY